MDSVDGSRASENATSQCDPCARSELVKEASTYCEQCEEYMCVTCVSIHSGFKLARNHSMVSGRDLVLTGQSGTTKLSLSYCTRHGDKEIQWFCKKHEAMFCNTCKIIEHRKCEIMTVSDKSASEYGESLADAMGSLESLKSKIVNLKSAREKSVEDVVNFRKSCESAVQQFKYTIMEKVERLEKEILVDVNKVVTAEAAVIQDHVNTCDTLIPQLELQLTTADEATSAADDVTSVIAAHNLSKILKTLEPTVSDLEQEVYDVHIRFQPSRQLTDVFCEIDQLGTVDIERTETAAVDRPESASPSACPVSGRKSCFDLKVAWSTEINVKSGNVTGSAVIPDGRLILADRSNKQIILLDIDLTIQSTLTLPCEPVDVAVYGDNAAVVTMPDMEQLQYIHVDTTLRAGHTIQTGVECWGGVAVHDGKIYVGVSGGQYGDHVQVMDTSGNVTRRIGADVRGTDRRYICPDYITVGTGGNVYISDYRSSRIMCYTEAGDMVYDVQHKGMSGPGGIAVDEEDNLLVCGFWSNTIHVLGKDGAHHRVILSSDDGLWRPQSVSYRRSDQMIIVTMNNTPCCRAYKLN